MIDREARNDLAENIAHLVAGVISNDKFEDRVHFKSMDPAIRGVFFGGPWGLYSDLCEHRLNGVDKLPDALRKEAARWILFLRSDLPYEWPKASAIADLQWLPLNLMTFGYSSTLRQRSFAKKGDFSVWPFFRRSDYEDALG